LIIDEVGNLYGTTFTGGKGPVAFELSPGKNPNRPWKLTILHTFCLANDGPCSDGDEPNGPLSYAGSETGTPYDGKSPLYGTTEAGGANARGTVFSLTPTASGWSETVLHDFCSQAECFDGESPDGNLLVGNDTLIGITNFGGAFSPGGTVFQLTREGGGWSDKVLYSFCAKTNCTDGRYPTGGLFADSSGALYGAFGAGGANAPFGGGTFRLTPKNQHWKYKRLNSFCGGSDCPKGTRPEGGVVADSAGAIYGTTIDGGLDRSGVVYEIAGKHTHVLHKFCSEPGGADGGQPQGSLIIDGSGRLYGTASVFGAHGDVHSGGVVFEIRR
jgi:uncharacterized repeat protein (TIGR03803 family)